LDGEPALRKEDEVLRAKASRARRAPFSKPLDLAAEKADLLSMLIASEFFYSTLFWIPFSGERPAYQS